MRRTPVASTALACAAALALHGPASADESHGHTDAPGTKSMEANFEFQLFSTEPPPGADFNDEFWAGMQTVAVGQFDPSLGTLNSVELTIGMNIAGSIFVVDNSQLNPDTFAFNGDEDGGYTYGSFTQLIFDGSASADPLDAEVDFGTYDVGVDGFFDGSVLVFDESGEGVGTSVETDDIAGFIGDGDIDVDIYASLIADYESESELGNAVDPIIASGWVRLTYDFDAANVVPSPTAATGGLALLMGLAIRRRKRRF
ncbi:MAG: choice-of-anchor E domain-containing protein [Planctomycetota bacterium]